MSSGARSVQSSCRSNANATTHVNRSITMKRAKKISERSTSAEVHSCGSCVILSCASPHSAIDSRNNKSITGDTKGRRIWKSTILGIATQPRGAVAGVAGRVAVLPDRLERAERPAEPLANQRVNRFGHFGVTDGVLVVQDFPAFAANGEREVRIFRNRFAGEASVVAQDVGAPGPHGAGHDRDAIQQIEGALFQILAGDVLERLPPGNPSVAIHHFYV